MKIKARKCLNQKKYWLKDILWKTPSLIHYFWWILCFPLGFFVCFENVPYMAFYSQKMGFWKNSQTTWDSFQNQVLMQKNFLFIVFGTLTCAHMPMYAYACTKHAHAGLEHACTYACMYTHALRFSWPFFSKNSLFSSWKSYIFRKHFPQVNFNLIRP